jgi:hypothetical protein
MFQLYLSFVCLFLLFFFSNLFAFDHIINSVDLTQEVQIIDSDSSEDENDEDGARRRTSDADSDSDDQLAEVVGNLNDIYRNFLMNRNNANNNGNATNNNNAPNNNNANRANREEPEIIDLIDSDNENDNNNENDVEHEVELLSV